MSHLYQIHHIVHHTHSTAVHVFDASTGKELAEGQPLRHQNDIVSLALSQSGPTHERLLTILDKNSDLFLTSVYGPTTFKVFTLGMLSRPHLMIDYRGLLVNPPKIICTSCIQDFDQKDYKFVSTNFIVHGHVSHSAHMLYVM